MTTLKIVPHDMVIARDGRPFGINSGNQMYSLDWIYPSVVAGALRTLVGKKMASIHPNPFSPENLEVLKSIAIYGPFPVQEDRVYFPAPRDVVFYTDGEDDLRLMLLRPNRMPEGAGCNMPHGELWPMEVNEDIKPTSAPAFWSAEKINKWLKEDGQPFGLIPRQKEDFGEDTGFLFPFSKDTRIQVAINHETMTVQDEHLFATSGLVFPVEPEAGLAIRVTDTPNLEIDSFVRSIETWQPLGGERRLSYFKVDERLDRRPSPELESALSNSRGVRMMLATPAIFEKGWLPNWINSDSLEGEPPGGKGLLLKLRGASIDRWKPISGWSFERSRPKPVRRMVAAGSVYFFEVIKGNPAAYLSNLWLSPVSDLEQDRRDGFGASLWGVWNL